MEAKWIWHDGGRAGAGFVGSTGDCVVRAIAIATGKEYREVYDAIYSAAGASPRLGVASLYSDKLLADWGFERVRCVTPNKLNFMDDIPGIVVLRFGPTGNRRMCGHIATMVDGTIYDTWDPQLEDDYVVESYWLAPKSVSATNSVIPCARRLSKRQQANNDSMARIVERIKKMRKVASNAAATEGEIENALRMASTMMLQHNIADEDLQEEVADQGSAFGRIAVFVNGLRCASWEMDLALYISALFGNVFCFSDRGGRRSRISFYGPIDSVERAVELFRELLVEIATLARLKYGGYAKGRGASYAEGFVAELRAILRGVNHEPAIIESNRMLTAKIELEAKRWLKAECDISLVHQSSGGRSGFDPSAAAAGRADGRTRNVTRPGQLRLS